MDNKKLQEIINNVNTQQVVLYKVPDVGSLTNNQITQLKTNFRNARTKLINDIIDILGSDEDGKKRTT